MSEQAPLVIEVTNETALTLRPAAVRKLVAGVLALEGGRGGVTVAFVSSSSMRELNHRYRGVDAPTDVLSFSFEVEDDDWPEVDGEEAYLGDVVICPEVATENATGFENTLDDELRRLVVHGVLHLLGYDHERDEGEMQRREEALLGASHRGPRAALVYDRAS